MSREPWEKRLGEAIRTHRKKRGLTLQQAADQYGCNLRWWQALEAGRNTSIDVLMRVSKVVKVDVWKLLK